MPYQEFDRSRVKMEPLSARTNKKRIEQDHVAPDAPPRELSQQSLAVAIEAAERVRTARERGGPVMFTFGAHAIKNGLGPVFIELIEKGWATHLATNGAGIIHDWEFAFQGQSCEHVEPMVRSGRFGNWQETGFYINLALNVGAHEGLGYGESVGALIEREGLQIPSDSELEEYVADHLSSAAEKSAAAADLLAITRRFDLTPGWMSVPHPWKRFSVQGAAFRNKVPFTGHPMFGHDIIYNHPMNSGGPLGRTAERDFLTYAQSVSGIGKGVYISIGSAVMSPMIFEKSLSISQNLALQRGESIDDHYILVNDLAESTWDWSQGEPPEENPAYYLRYNKSFSRMGGTLRYLQADNRDFLLTLKALLEGSPSENETAGS